MKYLKIMFGLAIILVTASLAAPQDGDRQRRFRAHLRGPNEVPLTLTGGRGELQLTVNEDESSVHFVLTYQGFLTHVMFAHIHVGQPNVNGGVTVFFCGGGGRPACPDQGTVEGDFTAANVIGLPSQQLDPNDLAKLLRAIRAGKTYANVHTMTSPGGEIRGQIVPGREREDEP